MIRNSTATAPFQSTAALAASRARSHVSSGVVPWTTSTSVDPSRWWLNTWSFMTLLYRSAGLLSTSPDQALELFPQDLPNEVTELRRLFLREVHLLHLRADELLQVSS